VLPIHLMKTLVGAALVMATICCTPALAQEYPFDISKRDPAAMKSWREIIPAVFRRQPWIVNFNGTAGPIDTVTIHSRVFYYGKVCIPHDCGGNFVAFLVARGGGEAFGALASETMGVRHQYFGAPDAEARNQSWLRNTGQ